MIKLRGITWDHPRGYQPLAASVAPYRDIAGVEVEWDKRSLKDFGDVPIDSLAGRYDLLIIDHPHVGLAAEAGCLLPLDSCLDPQTLAVLAGQSAGPSHASYTYAGRQWALAIDAAMQAAAYRPDLLAEPLPQSWDEVLDLGYRLRRQGRAIAIPLAPTDAICSFLSLAANLGDLPGSRSGQLVEAKTGRQVLQLLRALAGVAHPNSLDWNPIGLLDFMSQAGEVVYCPLTFCYTNYARSGYQPHLVRFFTIPGVTGALLGGAGFAVSARCRQPEAACVYGAWLCSAGVQRTFYLENGGQPGNVLAWRDLAANRLTHNFFADTLATLEGAFVRPRHNGFVAFQEAAGDIIHAFLRDGTGVEECLEELSRLYFNSLG